MLNKPVNIDAAKGAQKIVIETKEKVAISIIFDVENDNLFIYPDDCTSPGFNRENVDIRSNGYLVLNLNSAGRH